MPIYHKTGGASSGSHNTAEIDYHTSEAAKVKRTREQAYFNSYDFDAIEVLPYDDEEDDDDEKMRGTHKERGKFNSQTKPQQLKTKPLRTQTQTKSHHLPQQQLQHQMLEEPVKPRKTHPYHYSFRNNNDSSSSNSFMVDKPSSSSHQHHHNVNAKYNPSLYLQRFTGIFSGKSNLHSNNNNKPLHHHNNGVGVGVIAIVGGLNGTTDIALSSSHHGSNNKHLKLSSSETSSTSLSNSSIIIEEIVNVHDEDDDDIDVAGIGGVGNEGVIASSLNSNTNGNRAAVTLEASTRAGDVIVTRSKPLEQSTNNSTPLNATQSSPTATSTPAATGGNFSLPRAMLKYQSSTLNATQTGASGNTTNSMPLATNASSNSNSHSNNSPLSNSSRQQQQQPTLNLVAATTARDVHVLEGLKGKGNIMPSSVTGNLGLRLKKTSTSSSVITSLASEDIEDITDIEHGPKEEKVLPKTIIKPKVSARASSHQSHYSTDKSASSGYYSSNVCSTYSLEEHIYSEPTIDLKKLRNHEKESQASSLSKSEGIAAIAKVSSSAVNTLQNTNKLGPQQLNSLIRNPHESNSVMLALDFNKRYRYAEDKDLGRAQTLPSQRNSQEFNDNLKILESSIENLDRHLKSFPGSNSQETFNPYNAVNQNDKLRSATSYNHLPTIQEGFDAVKKQSWHEDRSDDSLMDIDLDSFLLDKEQKMGPKSKATLNPKGLDNPTFLTEEQEENHYKCAKYINSCPEDAYRVESDIHAPERSSISGQSAAVSVDLYPKRYEEQIHFQNTRELLEDVRDKIRLLTLTQEAEQKQKTSNSNEASHEDYIPKELHSMINTLKQELELYLDRMNQHSELEIRQLCTGLVKNQHIVKMKNAFERRRSLGEAPDIYSTYEAIQDGIVMNAQGVPISIRQQITSIRCSSDPNFKMKRKSITEVFPMAECYVESTKDSATQSPQQPQTSTSTNLNAGDATQMQRNLSYHKPVLDSMNTNQNPKATTKANNTSTSGNESSEAQDKDSMLDWHRKKPSIWELYYGTNRIQQSLLGGKKNGTMLTTAIASSPSTMCYPSSRPESDFTLDMPRAEQLRIKMEKEKKFRQRCRVITTFLSLVFFLLTVMVVSLVLTRGKRMFGSMI